jgi:hypothetical protein
MEPCFVLCSACKNYLVINKKASCTKGYFVLTLAEAMITVPLDYECVDYDTKRENNGKKE